MSNKSFISNDMPVIRQVIKAPSSFHSGGFVPAAPRAHAPAPPSRPAPSWAAPATPAPKAASTLRVGMQVRGANVPSNDSELLTKNFRGRILEFGSWGENDTRVEDIRTGKKFRVEKRFLREV